MFENSVLNEIHLNGNLQAKNQLIFEWIIFELGFQQYRKYFSRLFMYIQLKQLYSCRSISCQLLPFHPVYSPVRLLELTTLVLCFFKDLGSPAFRELVLFQKDNCVIEQSLSQCYWEHSEVENELVGILFIQGTHAPLQKNEMRISSQQKVKYCRLCFCSVHIYPLFSWVYSHVPCGLFFI